MLRIVGGRFSGQRIASPKGSGTRPTSERVREALASILESRNAIADAAVLDLFCGTGALALEMLSRGAARAMAVDRDRRLTSAVEANRTRFAVDVRAMAVDLLGPPSRTARVLAPHGPWNLILVDAPYSEIAAVSPLLGALCDAGSIRPESYVVIEHARALPPSLPEALATIATYRYGDTGLTLATTAPTAAVAHNAELS